MDKKDKERKEEKGRYLTAKEMPAEYQPREKAKNYGVERLDLSELWALILRTGIQGQTVMDLCKSMLFECDNQMTVLERKSLGQLMRIPGIGETKAVQIKAVTEIARRYSMELLERDRYKRYVIKDPESIYKYMMDKNVTLPHEEIWVLYLSQSNVVMKAERISSGGSKASVFDLKAILRRALDINGCESLVMCHNHPSGNLRPSGADDNITRALREGAKALDLRLLDHLIVSTDGYYSYQEHDRI